MSRPYRHVSTENLVNKYNEIWPLLQEATIRGLNATAGGIVRELERVAKELDRRKLND